jgi:hypothetical protein
LRFSDSFERAPEIFWDIKLPPAQGRKVVKVRNTLDDLQPSNPGWQLIRFVCIKEKAKSKADVFKFWSTSANPSSTILRMNVG